MAASNTTFSGEQIVVLYDGSWPGLLTAVFEIYAKKWQPTRISSAAAGHAADLFARSIEVVTDPEKAMRVWNGLQAIVPKEHCMQLYRCFLSEMEGMELTIFHCIKLYFDSKGEAQHAFGHPDVLKVSQVARSVYREKHRMEAFVRFRQSADGIYCAGIEPDFNVVPLLVKHFKERYADQPWIIYDLRRKYGIYYDLDKVEEISLDEGAFSQTEESTLHENETMYQDLWKEYFEHVNIPSRRNIQLHVRHVPKRYWKHLTEKQ